MRLVLEFLVWRTYHAYSESTVSRGYVNIPFKFFAEFWGRNPADLPYHWAYQGHPTSSSPWQCLRCSVIYGKVWAIARNYFTVFTEKLTDDSRIVCICSREGPRSKQLIANSEWSLELKNELRENTRYTVNDSVVLLVDIWLRFQVRDDMWWKLFILLSPFSCLLLIEAWPLTNSKPSTLVRVCRTTKISRNTFY